MFQILLKKIWLTQVWLNSPFLMFPIMTQLLNHEALRPIPHLLTNWVQLSSDPSPTPVPLRHRHGNRPGSSISPKKQACRYGRFTMFFTALMGFLTDFNGILQDVKATWYDLGVSEHGVYNQMTILVGWWSYFQVQTYMDLSWNEAPQKHPKQKLPSGKLTYLWKVTIFHGKFHYKWWFSIVMLNYQRVIISLPLW